MTKEELLKVQTHEEFIKAVMINPTLLDDETEKYASKLWKEAYPEEQDLFVDPNPRNPNIR